MKILISVLCFFLLISCEKKDEKISRLTIDTCSNKLNSILGTIVETRVEEGQSDMSGSDLYNLSISRLDEYMTELNKYKITTSYLPYRDWQVLSAKNLTWYINYRKNAIASLSNVTTSYESASRIKSDLDEYQSLMSSSSDKGYYADLVRRSLNEYDQATIVFADSKISYAGSIQRMDSIVYLLDSMVQDYNRNIEGTRLIEKITLPFSFHDTINDWLLSNKSYYMDLQVNPPDL